MAQSSVPWLRRPAPGYAFAVFTAAVVTGLMLSARPLITERPAPPFLLAVLLVGWVAGFGPAVVTCGLGMLAIGYLFAPAVPATTVPDWLVWAVLFLGVGVAMAWVASPRRGVEARERAAGGEAERRAAELGATVSALTGEMEVVIYDEAGEIVRMSPAGELYMDLPPQERRLPLPARMGLLRPETADGRPLSVDETPVARALRGETVHGFIMVGHPPRSAKPVWTISSAAPIRATDGRLLGAALVFADVTRLHERFRGLVEWLPDAMILVNREGTIVQANAHAERLFGYGPEELVGQRVDVFVPERLRGIHGKHREGYSTSPTVRPMGAGLRLHGRRKDGSEFPVEISLGPLETEEGMVVASAIRDVTDRQKAEAERIQLVREQAARREAETANRAKDDFLAMLSHELRSPLNAIMAWSQVLAKKSDPDVRHAVEVVDRNARVLTRLVDDLLEVSRIVAGRLPMERRPVAVAPLVDSLVDTMQPAAPEKGVALHRVLDPSSAVVWADPARLHQAIGNLVSNSIKFTPAGGSVEVRVDGGESEVTVSVSDTGKGITAEFLPHVFERFRQQDTTTARPHGGLGLGLAIVRRLVEAHGGTVEADSPGSGRGARFTIRLPVLRPGQPGDAGGDRRGTE